jgi:dihydroflavonol-4-reductase
MAIDLVTGATGLVGGNLVRALVARGRQVRILVRPSSRTAHLDDLPTLERTVGDVTEPESLVAACDGAEHVYHCAALVSMWARRAEAMWQVNVGGTDHVIAAARHAGVRRLVHCSSVDAIGLPESDAPATEDTPWNWDRLGFDNAYARTKLVAQEHVLAAARADLDAVVVNPGLVLGPYDTRPSSGELILGVAAGQALGYPSGGNNVVDVGDVAAGMIAAAERGERGQLYILGGENLSYRDLLTRVAEVLRVSPPRIPLPYVLARVGGWAGDLVAAATGREPRITTLVARMGYVRHYYSPAKAIARLGMPQTPLRETIEHAVRWFRAVGMLRL